MSEIKNKFPEMLKKLLTEKGITQREIANLLGIRANAVAMYVMGEALPKMDSLIKIALHLGVSIDYLVTGENLENKIVRDDLGLSEKALRTLSLLAKTDKGKLALQHIGTLICDDEFVKTLTATIERFEDDVSAYPRPEELSPAERVNPLAYMDYSEEKAAKSMYEFFKDFFKRHNIFRPLYRRF